MRKIILFFVFISFTNPVLSQDKKSERFIGYGEFEAESIKKPKFVQIKPVNFENFQQQSYSIETLGYSEIRVFVELFKSDYKNQPLPKNSSLKLIFTNEMTGIGSPFKSITFNRDVSAVIDGWAIEKIFGRKTKLIVDAENVPKGEYTLHLSYYLIP